MILKDNRNYSGIPVIIMDPSTGQKTSSSSVRVLLNIAGVEAKLHKRNMYNFRQYFSSKLCTFRISIQTIKERESKTSGHGFKDSDYHKPLLGLRKE